MDIEDHKKEHKWRKHKLIVLTLIIAVLQSFLMYEEGNIFSHAAPVLIGGHAMDHYSLLGVCGVFKAIFCALITIVDFRIGGNIAFAAVIIDIIRLAVSVMAYGHMEATVGIVNQLMLVVIIFAIRMYLKKVNILTTTDELTGLKNRFALMSDLALRGEKKDPFTIIYLGLDNFKYINDTHGHLSGDRVLREVAIRLRGNLPKGAELYRMGGDEFMVIYPHDGSEKSLQNAEAIASRLVTCIEAKQFDREASHVDKYLTVSGGVVTYPKDTSDTTTLVGYADVAMYHAKHSGKNKFFTFDEEMGKKIQRELEMEALIREGLDKNLFYLVYQPQFTSKGKRLRGFESLLRLKTESGEFISPGEFIPVAERTDLIIAIDRMVLRRALTEFHAAVTAPGSSLMISVNVSSKHIAQPDFIDEVKAALEECNFPPNHLELEITEYSMIENVDTVVETMNQLKEMGVEIAMDDFGSGYASLSWLSKMPIDLLKIDKSLVDDIEGSARNTEFVNLIIAMGHLLGADVVAEGVEHESQKEILKEKDCNFIQGFLWSKPLEYQKALECVAEDRKLDKA